jgi:PRC-barrel domain protein
MAEERVATYTNVVPVNKAVIGSKVVNPENEDLGTIEDVVLDVEAGRVAYAVLSFGGFLGMGNKYFAIPWEAFRFKVADKRATLNADKKLLENAPGFDKDHWPNMADPSWRSQIYSHYGYRTYAEGTPEQLPTHDRGPVEGDANATKESIELAGEAVFEALYHKGDMELQKLRSTVDIPAHIFDRAIDWLVGKQDIQLLREGETLIVHRTDPAFAVLPFRGN